MTQLDLAESPSAADSIAPGDYHLQHRTKPDIAFTARIHEHRGVLHVRPLSSLGRLDDLSLDENPGVELARMIDRYELTPIAGIR